MKLLRTLLAFTFATALAGASAFADGQGAKSEVKADKAGCGCVVGKDKKVCGVDKDCCCTGEKAKGKKADKKKEASCCVADKKDSKPEAKACCTESKCEVGKGEKKAKKAEKKDCCAGGEAAAK